MQEHDQDPGDQRPVKIDGDLVLPDLVGNVWQRYPNFGVSQRNIVDGSGDGSARITGLQLIGGWRLGGRIFEFCRRGRRWRWSRSWRRRRSCRLTIGHAA